MKTSELLFFKRRKYWNCQYLYSGGNEILVNTHITSNIDGDISIHFFYYRFVFPNVPIISFLYIYACFLTICFYYSFSSHFLSKNFNQTYYPTELQIHIVIIKAYHWKETTNYQKPFTNENIEKMRREKT